MLETNQRYQRFINDLVKQMLQHNPHLLAVHNVTIEHNDHLTGHQIARCVYSPVRNANRPLKRKL